MSKAIGQSVCRVCCKPVNPGAGVVLSYGAGGRVHSKECLVRAQKPAVLHEGAEGRARPYDFASGELRAGLPHRHACSTATPPLANLLKG